MKLNFKVSIKFLTTHFVKLNKIITLLQFMYLTLYIQIMYK